MSATIHELGIEHAPWRWALEFDFDQTMVDALKDNIPARERTWKPDLRQWWFKPAQLMAVHVLAERHCGSVTYAARAGDAPTAAASTEIVTAYRALHLQPTAPDELVKAAYRVMCKLRHPDKGGDTASMQAINRAYSLLAARSRGKANTP